MGEVKVSVNEEGAPEVQHHYLGFLLTQVRPEDSERHRVVQWLIGIKEATFNRWLKFCFLTVLTMAVIKLLMFNLLLHNPPTHYSSEARWNYRYNQTWLLGNFPIGQKGVILLTVFVAVVVVGVFAKKTKKSAASAPPTREQGQIISAHVQQV